MILGPLKAALLLAVLIIRAPRWKRNENARMLTYGVGLTALAVIIGTATTTIDPAHGARVIDSIAVLLTMLLIATACGCLTMSALRAIRFRIAADVIATALRFTVVALIACWAFGGSRRDGSWDILQLDDPADRLFALIYGLWWAGAGITTLLATSIALWHGSARKRTWWATAALCASSIFSIGMGTALAAHAVGLVTLHSGGAQNFLTSLALIFLCIAGIL